MFIQSGMTQTYKKNHLRRCKTRKEKGRKGTVEEKNPGGLKTRTEDALGQGSVPRHEALMSQPNFFRDTKEQKKTTFLLRARRIRTLLNETQNTETNESDSLRTMTLGGIPYDRRSLRHRKTLQDIRNDEKLPTSSWGLTIGRVRIGFGAIAEKYLQQHNTNPE